MLVEPIEDAYPHRPLELKTVTEAVIPNEFDLLATIGEPTEHLF